MWVSPLPIEATAGVNVGGGSCADMTGETPIDKIMMQTNRVKIDKTVTSEERFDICLLLGC
jgi:hypothetical protein